MTNKEIWGTFVDKDFYVRQDGAHILDLGTIGFVTSGLGQLSITYN